jgi:hypothetical protein
MLLLLLLLLLPPSTTQLLSPLLVGVVAAAVVVVVVAAAASITITNNAFTLLPLGMPKAGVQPTQIHEFLVRSALDYLASLHHKD